MQQTNKRNWTKALAVCLALVLAVSLSACGKKDGSKAEGKDDSKVVATYKDGEITQKEFDTFLGVNQVMDSTGQVAQMLASEELKSYIQDQFLQQLAVWKVLDAKTTDENRKEGDKKADELEKQINDMEAESKTSFEAALKESKITVADLKKYVSMTYSIVHQMEQSLTDKDIQEAYDANVKTNANFYDVVNVRHILIVTKETDSTTGESKEKRTKEEALKLAKEVKAKLDAGGDFAALAKEYSEDPGSKDNGGLYENQQIGTSQFVAPFLKAMTEQEVGKVSDPVETDFGYHLIKVDSRKTLSFADEKESLRSEKAQTKLSEFVQNDFPSYEFKSNLPQPSVAPSASPAATGETSPVASPAASPIATEAVSPSPAATK
ncbi:peptidylprolyl isomerase [Gorillibacterium timonense]|uniref:peptidylprolyl isomerase n=1 Tax=Gorillibacterium timonense TaxID=1689269 RepID=UPI00071DE939|nr:peptidylprolyl isomerase [Gorillibacterium timonense]